MAWEFQAQNKVAIPVVKPFHFEVEDYLISIQEIEFRLNYTHISSILRASKIWISDSTFQIKGSHREKSCGN